MHAMYLTECVKRLDKIGVAVQRVTLPPNQRSMTWLTMLFSRLLEASREMLVDSS